MNLVLLICLMFTATPRVQHQAVLVWSASTTPKVNYRVYRGAKHGGPYSRIASNINVLTYKDTNVRAGHTYYYVVRAYNSTSNLESNNSPEAEGVIP